jgi:hypothetical protein
MGDYFAVAGGAVGFCLRAKAINSRLLPRSTTLRVRNEKNKKGNGNISVDNDDASLTRWQFSGRRF